MTNAASVLDRTAAFLRRYVVFASAEQVDAVALWVGHTWLYDQFDTTAYLAIQSPEKRSGKSRLLEALRLLVRDGVPMAGVSLAAFFRLIDERHPTVLFDEADAVFNKRTSDSTEDIRGALNNGYRRGVPFWRVVGDGKKMRVESFDVFCPKAIASIRALPDTVQDRSIVIALKRRARHEMVERFRFRGAEQEAIPIREWWESIAEALRLAEQADCPDELDDRAADSWEPLLALADAAGGEWPMRARRAALVLSGASEPDDDTLSVRLLDGIRDAFASRAADRLATSELLDVLRADEEAPWDEWHGRGLKAEGLSYLLRPYGIRPRQMKVAGVKVRGYDLDQFTDAFTRYLPSVPHTPPTRYPGTAEHKSEHERTEVPGEVPVPEGRENGSVPDDDPHGYAQLDAFVAAQRGIS
jgi:hypothetical protein